jgi:hypothetical protein
MRKLISTLMLGALLLPVAKATVILDPNDATSYGTLPDGVTVVDTLGKKAFRIVLNGWSLIIPTAATVNLGTDTYIHFYEVQQENQTCTDGTTLTLTNSNVFVQPMLPDMSGGACSVTGTPESASAWNYMNGSNAGGIDVGSVQIAVQDKGNSWNAVSGAVIYLSKIETIDELVLPTASPETFYSVPFYDDIVTIDGSADEYDAAAVANINRQALTVAGATGTLQMLWDADFLYVMANVTDGTVVTYPSESTQPWMNDGIEIFADIKDRFLVNKRLSSAQPQIRFNVGRKTSDGVSDSCDYGGLYGVDPAMSWAFKTVSGGYGFEVQIPWAGLVQVAVKEASREAFLADSIIEGKQLAFEISILDCASMDARTSISNWSNNTGSDVSYNSSEHFGQLTLTTNTAVKYASASAFRMYPNPASSVVSISAKGLRSVEIVNVSGQVVAKKLASSDNATVGVAGMKAGVYFVKVYDANGYVGARKLMVK